jgi:alginate O-acetyltransferase complex protein AlgI
VVFSSIPFIFIFLPVFLIIYYLIPNKSWRHFALLFGSLFFIFWADPSNLLLIIAISLIDYLLGYLIFLTTTSSTQNRISKYFLIIGISINLINLVFYKYSNFLISTFFRLFSENIEIPVRALPLGISFFSFTGIAYLIDVYNQPIAAEKDPKAFFSFLLMFPKLVLGPITRYQEVEYTLTNKWFENEKLGLGIERFVAGLGKKVILADNLSIITEKVFGSQVASLSPAVSWFGLISYALQIFFDFSGYTDMAIGLGLILGIKLPENFAFPYSAKSITEFWRRWHMTLSFWFRTYIFIPLEFRWRKLGKARQPLVIMIVFLITGLWHGAGWNFILWGGYFGLFLSFESLGLGRWLKKIPAFFQHFYTLLVVSLGWVLFRISDSSNWLPFYKSLLGINISTNIVTLRSLNVLLYIPLLIISILFATPIMDKLNIFIHQKKLLGKAIIFVYYLGVFILSISYILSNGYVSFLYSQF